MSKTTNTFLLQREKARADFVAHWDWPRVFQHWTRHITEANQVIQPLFSVVEAHDPMHPFGRITRHSWWPVRDFEKLRQELQYWYFQHPGTVGPIHPHSDQRAGEAASLSILADYNQDVERIAAVLIAGSLFPRMGSRRARYPDFWPPRHAVEALSEWVCKVLNWHNLEDGWHPSCTSVIPYQSHDYDYQIETMESLVRYLAEEHIGLLLRYRPVVINFINQAPPFLEKMVRDRQSAEARRHAEFDAKMAQRRAEGEAQLAEHRTLHPRYGEWESLTPAELSKLVWSKPTVEVAKDFGISDSAVGKNCKNQGIPKPPAGFWAKVRAGKIPNPEGIAPQSRQTE
jgi:hypothetical protein